MSTSASPVKLPEWVERVDPVAWFPVVAFVILATLCALAGNIWLAIGATFVAASIVVLESVVFGSAWVRERSLRRAAARAQPVAPYAPAMPQPARPDAYHVPVPRPAPQAPRSNYQPPSYRQGPMPHGQARV